MADPIAVNMYQLAGAGIWLFDDRPPVNVDVCRGGDTAPEDGVRARGIESHRRRKGHDSNAAQKKFAHNPLSKSRDGIDRRNHGTHTGG